ncbi:MAG TPA: minichromosome maintenance protein MCM [Methanocella sp.]
MGASVISSTSKWKEFLTRYYKNQIQQLAVSDAKNKALVIEYPHINRFDVRLAEELIASPDVVLAHAEEALTMVDLPVKKEISARVRVAKVPKKTQVRDLRSIDVNRYIAIEGTIRKITDVRPRIIEAAFECARCKNVTIIPQEGGGKFIEPTYCQCNEEKKGVFRLLYKESRFEDYQRIKIQESPDELKGGEQPQTLDINVSDDLAGQVTPGEHISVNGILRSAQKINKDGKTAYFDIYMDGNSIELEEQEYDEVDISPEDEEEIMRLAKDPRVYDKIVYSIAPSIYGYEEVKEAIAHQLFSGVVKSLPDGTRIRGDIHVLLVGDPGIAKSQILRYVVKLAPRGVYASGKSASSAGLTAAAVKDEFDGQWTLEAGALVLADKGVACIDEMDKMKNEDRSSLHEGMESQTISVAKAGILATLKCRCSILGAANPKLGRFDPYENIPEQINMPPSLMSRFDLIFILQDKPEERRDANIAGHILKSHYAGELNEHRRNVATSGVTEDSVKKAMSVITPEIEPRMLRKYIAYAKRKIFPIMSEEAREQIIAFYLSLRKQSEGENASIAITARQLEGLVRLSEASARMRLRDKVTLDDVERTIRIVTTSLRQVGMDQETGKLDIDRLTVGVAKSQRDRIKSLKHIIEELAKEYDGAVPIDAVIDKAIEGGLTKDKVEKELKKLKEIGEIFEPKTGHVNLS